MSGSKIELEIVERFVDTALAEQGIARPLLDDTAFVHHKNVLGFLNGGKTVRDH